MIDQLEGAGATSGAFDGSNARRSFAADEAATRPGGVDDAAEPRGSTR